MIKKLIFDVDDTLIKWEHIFSILTVENAFKDLKIPYNLELINKVNEAINNYEDKYKYYKKDLLLKHINFVCNSNFSNEFIDKYLENCATLAVPKKLPDDEIKTLEYLSSKYELVCLSNWFADVQSKRLEKVNILKYFSKIIGTENIKVKPYEESFINASLPEDKKNCAMVGDNLSIDILGALNVGIKAFYITDKKINLENCICIKNVSELKNYL